VDVAQAMGDGLRQLGADVLVATSYDEAAACIAARRLDAVVTDLHLGGARSGLDVARFLRSQGHADVPVIAVSAFGTVQDQRATSGAGFADHLVKPVDVQTVARALARRVAQRSRGVEPG
jgi:DNA-binding response OmpR family regulator